MITTETIDASVLLDGSDCVSPKIDVVVDFDKFYLSQEDELILMTKEQAQRLLEIVNDH